MPEAPTSSAASREMLSPGSPSSPIAPTQPELAIATMSPVTKRPTMPLFTPKK
jgi:hypothetical protein